MKSENRNLLIVLVALSPFAATYVHRYSLGLNLQKPMDKEWEYRRVAKPKPVVVPMRDTTNVFFKYDTAETPWMVDCLPPTNR